MEIEGVIRETFSEVLQTSGQVVKEPLTADSVLLKTGLDSLGFAILVARLEETLGYDPFIQMTTPAYPKTFGEFIAIYEKFKPLN